MSPANAMMVAATVAFIGSAATMVFSHLQDTSLALYALGWSCFITGFVSGVVSDWKENK